MASNPFRPSQAKPSQAKPSQIKINQNQDKATIPLRLCVFFLYRQVSSPGVVTFTKSNQEGASKELYLKSRDIGTATNIAPLQLGNRSPLINRSGRLRHQRARSLIRSRRAFPLSAAKPVAGLKQAAAHLDPMVPSYIVAS
eukprot:scaffold825_cov249-Pinguiococcus_pyrenoidosus.AAC.40